MAPVPQGAGRTSGRPRRDITPPERPLECPAPGCQVKVLPSEASSPAGHCPAHGHLWRGRQAGQGRPRRTHCRRGHDLTIPSNTYRDDRGRVRCRVCRRRQEELDARVCAWGDCQASLKGYPHARKFCDAHREEAARAKVREWHARERQGDQIAA